MGEWQRGSIYVYGNPFGEGKHDCDYAFSEIELCGSGTRSILFLNYTIFKHSPICSPDIMKKLPHNNCGIKL